MTVAPPDRSPVRSTRVLEQWIADFRAESGLSCARIHVAPQDAAFGRDAGLVILRPQDSDLSVYMQPRALDDPHWELTIPGRELDVTMTDLQLGALAVVVLEAARLCTYLQFRSLEEDRRIGLRHDVV